MNWKIKIAGGILAVSLTACTSTTATKETTSTTDDASSAPAAVQETTPPAVVEPTETPDDPGIAKVGASQWFTYEDGLKVQVTKLTRFKIGPYAAGGKPGGTGVIATVTMRNGTGKPFDVALASVKLQSGPNGVEADQVYDSSANIGSGFEGTIPNGRAKTARFGFAVPKTHMAKIAVEVAPSWEHDASFFEGAAR